MNIFERIKIIAKEKNLTISDVESLANLSNGSISKWDKSVPKADALYKVSCVLETSLEYFLTGNMSTPYALSKDESSLIENYRHLNAKDRNEIGRIIEMKLEDAFQISSISPSGKKNMDATNETA